MIKEKKYHRKQTNKLRCGRNSSSRTLSQMLDKASWNMIFLALKLTYCFILYWTLVSLVSFLFEDNGNIYCWVEYHYSIICVPGKTQVYNTEI